VVGGIPAAGLGPEDPTQTVDPLDEAEIVRDDKGVPHIYADSERSLYYANGYVQAQDRLWAMDLFRHISYGEAASVVGPGGGILEMDLQTRRNLYSEEQLREQYEEASPQFKRIAEAFSDGVNRAAAEMNATGDMPAEFPALQHTFEEWRPVDVVATATWQLAFFGNGGGEEVANAQLFGQLEEELGTARASSAFADLVWGERSDTYTTIPDETYTRNDPHADAKPWAQIPEAQREVARAAVDAESFGLGTEPVGIADQGLLAGQDLSTEDFGFGSNALLVGPQHSASGEAMLGGGPQTGYFNPNLFYEVGLHSEELGIDAEGIGALTTPSVIIGRTADMAWSVTSGVSDQTDMVALEAIGERSFAWDEEERRLDCREEEHEIFVPPATGGPERRVVTQEVCQADLSITGGTDRKYPVTDIVRDDEGEPEWFFARKTSARMDETTSSEKWLTLHQQDSVDDFRELFEGFSFTFNFHFAGEDEDGEQRICYFHVGRQPVRDDRLDPRFPTPSGDAWSWEATITGSELPHTCDPDQGYLANWNNMPQDGWSSGDSRELWGSVHRVERLDREVNEAIDTRPEGLDLDDVQNVLKDAATEDSLAGQIVPSLLAYDQQLPAPVQQALEEWGAADYPWRAGEAGTAPSEATVSNHTDEDYTEPDGLVYVDPGHTVYDQLLPALLDEVFGDELDDLVREVNWDPRDSGDVHAGDHGTANNKFGILVDALDGRTTRNWCDDAATPTRAESCADQVEDAVARAGFDDLASVDDVDLTEQHHSPVQSLGVGPAYVMPMTNRATYYHFHVGSDETRHQATLPPGAGGNINVAEFGVLTATGETPEHVDDQIPDYVDFDPKTVPFSQASAEADAESTQTLFVPTAP
jgi:penicillin amidase